MHQSLRYMHAYLKDLGSECGLISGQKKCQREAKRSQSLSQKTSQKVVILDRETSQKELLFTWLRMHIHVVTHASILKVGVGGLRPEKAMISGSRWWSKNRTETQDMHAFG